MIKEMKENKKAARYIPGSLIEKSEYF